MFRCRGRLAKAPLLVPALRKSNDFPDVPVLWQARKGASICACTQKSNVATCLHYPWDNEWSAPKRHVARRFYCAHRTAMEQDVAEMVR